MSSMDKKKMGCGCGKMNCESFEQWLEQTDPEMAAWLQENK